MSMMTTNYVHAKDDGEWVGNREDLTEDMREMCEGVPIRKVTNEPLTEEEFNDMMNGVGQQGTRKKRRIWDPPPFPHCCGRGWDDRWVPRRDIDDLRDAIARKKRSTDGVHIRHTIVLNKPYTNTTGSGDG